MVTVRSGRGTSGARLSRSDMCTAGSGLSTAWLTRNITAWPAWPSAGVNQNSSVHPVRRCRTAGLNGPAEAAIAANVSYPARAPSTACVRRNNGRRQMGVRTGMRTLSTTRTSRKYSEIVWLRAARTASTRHDAMVITGLPNTYDKPAGDDAGHEPAQLGRRRGIGPHQGVRDARAEQQGTACDRAPGDRVRRRFCCSAPPGAAAAARNPLDAHVSKQRAEHSPENGHAGPAHRWICSAADEHACRALHATGGPGEASPPVSRHPQRSPDGRGVIEAACAAIQLARPGHGEGRAAADSAAGGDGRYALTDADHPARLLGIRLDAEAVVRRIEPRSAQIEVDIRRVAARGLLTELPDLRPHRRAFLGVPAGRLGQAAARLTLARPDGAGDLDAPRLSNGRAAGIGRIRVAVQAQISGRAC